MPNMTKAAAEMRKFLKENGIKARCRVSPASSNSFQVYPWKYGMEFTPEQIEKFTQKAIDMGATYVRGMPIDVSKERLLTGKNQFEFYLWDE